MNALTLVDETTGYVAPSAASVVAGEADEDEDEEDAETGDEDEDGDEEDGDEDGDLEEGGGAEKEPLTIKAFVALSDQVHSIVLPLDAIDSWGGLSQTIHEVCEDSDVPDLPDNGIMHIVLNINGATVPVTGKTPIDELWRAKAIKVSITGAEDEEGEEDDDDDEERQQPTRQMAE